MNEETEKSWIYINDYYFECELEESCDDHSRHSINGTASGEIPYEIVWFE